MKNIISVFAISFIVIVIGNVVIVAQEKKDLPITAAEQKAVVETLTRDLNENYVFPDVAQQIGKTLTSGLKSYSSITSSREFAKALTKDLQSVNGDGHLRVRFSYDKIPARAQKTEPSEQEIRERQEFMKQVNYGFDSVKRLGGNIGYIELRGFMDPEMGEDTVAAAMTLVSNTDSLIIDLRRNGGGSPGMVALICSYFFGDEKVHLNDLYWRKGNQTNEFWTTPKVKGTKYLDKDIYILTSKRTFSAAEEFSYNLRNLKRAKIVGETTGGGAHPGGSFILGDHFSAFIATGRAISPITKTNWEGTGVKPHIAVSKELALETAYKQALENSAANAGSDREKASLKRLIDKTSKKIIEIAAKKKTD
jgi:C-terminal processing protease CtpA/Prc